MLMPHHSAELDTDLHAELDTDLHAIQLCLHLLPVLQEALLQALNAL